MSSNLACQVRLKKPCVQLYSTCVCVMQGKKWMYIVGVSQFVEPFWSLSSSQMEIGTFTGMFVVQHPSQPALLCSAFCIISHEKGEARRGESRRRGTRGEWESHRNKAGCICVQWPRSMAPPNFYDMLYMEESLGMRLCSYECIEPQGWVILCTVSRITLMFCRKTLIRSEHLHCSYHDFQWTYCNIYGFHIASMQW